MQIWKDWDQFMPELKKELRALKAKEEEIETLVKAIWSSAKEAHEATLTLHVACISTYAKYEWDHFNNSYEKGVF